MSREKSIFFCYFVEGFMFCAFFCYTYVKSDTGNFIEGGEKMNHNHKEKERFTDKVDWKEFGERVRSLMKLAGVTVQMLAEDLGMQYRSMHNVLKGYSRPSLDLLLGLAFYFNVSIDYLLGRSNVPYVDIVDEEGNLREIDNEVLVLAQQIALLNEREKMAITILVSSILGVQEELSASLEDSTEKNARNEE